MGYKFQHVLITGGAGFIGCNFIRYLLMHDSKVKIVNLDLLTYAGSLDNLKDFANETRHTFIKGNICDWKLVNQILRKYQIDTVVHFAAESHVDRSILEPATFIQTNIMGTFILLEAVKHYWLEEKKWDARQCRFHHVSTDEVYGTLKISEPAFTEITPYAPNSPYSASKASSDHLVRAYFHTYSLPITISNCSNNYGSYQHPEKFIPTIINACLNWKPIPIYGDGSNIRDWLYVMDHCEAIFKILLKGKIGESYNIGGNNELSNKEIANKICELMDKVSPRDKSYKNLMSFIKDRRGHDWRYAIDNRKIFSELAGYTLTPLEEGLIRTVNFFEREISE